MVDFSIATVIPCLNEKDYIIDCLNSLREQDFDNSKHLIWVLDGGSTDGTIQLVETYIQGLEQNHSPKIELLHNKEKFVPHARNYALQNLPDSVKHIIEMIAHSTVESNHMTLREEAWMNCEQEAARKGKKLASLGFQVLPAKGETTTQEEWIEACLSSRFGSGNGQFARITKAEYTKVPAFVTHLRSALEEIGGWSEEFQTSQDSDLSMRLLSAGYAIMRTPDTHVNMRKRNSLRKWWRMSVRYGFWRTKVLLKYQNRVSLREFLPWFGLLLTFGLSLVTPSLAVVPPLLYSIILAGVGFNSTLKSRKLSHLLGVPISLIILHVGFSIGLIQGLFVRGKNANDR